MSDLRRAEKGSLCKAPWRAKPTLLHGLDDLHLFSGSWLRRTWIPLVLCPGELWQGLDDLGLGDLGLGDLGQDNLALQGLVDLGRISEKGKLYSAWMTLV